MGDRGGRIALQKNYSKAPLESGAFLLRHHTYVAVTGSGL